jgi:hypothetical protein
MATLFLEPGGDATFNANIKTAVTPGLWDVSIHASPSVVSDFVNSSHLRSIKIAPNVVTDLTLSTSYNVSQGRISFWMYINAFPSSDFDIFGFMNNSLQILYSVGMTSTGVLKSIFFGTTGSFTFATGQWYHITLAYTMTSNVANSFRTYVNGVLSLSNTNSSSGNSYPGVYFSIANGLNSGVVNTTLDLRISDIYVDDSSALTDTGNIYVTAKRPFANGTTNGFTTQIGAGGSGYGSGHAPQVNERPLNLTNGWSVINAGSAITEEYSIEGLSIGDFNLTGKTIIDYMGWVCTKALTAETGSIIVSGTNNSISITTSAKIFQQIKGSTTYPTGNTDIGMISSTTVTTVSLYESGIIFAFMNSTANKSNFLMFM